MLDDKGRIVGKWRGVLPTEEPWNLPSGLSYEQYYKILSDMLKDKPPKEWTKSKAREDGQCTDSSKDGDSSPDPQEIKDRLEKCKAELQTPKGEKRYVHIEDLNLEELSEEELESIKQESERISQELSGEL